MNRLDLQDKTDEEVKALADAGEYIAIFEYGIRLFNQDRYRESYLFTFLPFYLSTICQYQELQRQ